MTVWAKKIEGIGAILLSAKQLKSVSALRFPDYNRFLTSFVSESDRYIS